MYDPSTVGVMSCRGIAYHAVQIADGDGARYDIHAQAVVPNNSI
jgi:hypothetical protein